MIEELFGTFITSSTEAKGGLKKVSCRTIVLVFIEMQEKGTQDAILKQSICRGLQSTMLMDAFKSCIQASWRFKHLEGRFIKTLMGKNTDYWGTTAKPNNFELRISAKLECSSHLHPCLLTSVLKKHHHDCHEAIMPIRSKNIIRKKLGALPPVWIFNLSRDCSVISLLSQTS